MSDDLFDEYLEGRIVLPLNYDKTDRFSMQLNEIPCFDDESEVDDRQYCVTMSDAAKFLRLEWSHHFGAWCVLGWQFGDSGSKTHIPPGDRVVSVDGLDVSNMSKRELYRATCREHVVKFERPRHIFIPHTHAEEAESEKAEAFRIRMLRDAVERALWDQEQLMMQEVQDSRELLEIETKKVTDPILVAADSQALSLSNAQTSIDLLRGEVADLKQYIVSKALSHKQELAKQANLLTKSGKETDALRHDLELLRMQFNTFSLACDTLEVVHDPF
jgi:hypothetical protein